MNRGADKQDVFSGSDDFSLFETLIGEEFQPEEIRVHAYALMTNHFHLLVEAPDGGIPEAMQRLCGRYASAYNQRSDRTGPVFTGRYKDVAVESERQFRAAARYIHRNPLPIVGVRRLHTYPWSSLSALLGHERPTQTWLARGLVVANGETAEEYLTFVLAPRAGDVVDGPWGDPPRLPIETVEAVLARATGLDVAALGSDTSRRADWARLLACTILLDVRSARPDVVARRLGLEHPNSVRRLARRGRVRASRDPEFREVRRSLLTEIAMIRSRPGEGGHLV